MRTIRRKMKTAGKGWSELKAIVETESTVIAKWSPCALRWHIRKLT